MNKIAKQILISLLFLLFLNLNFYSLKLFFFQNGELWTSLVFFFITLLFVLLFFIFVVLSFLRPLVQDGRDIKDSSLRHIIYIFGSLFIFLWFGFSVYTLIAAFALILFFLLADFSVAREEKSFYKFRFEKIFARAQINILLGFAILLAFLVFLSPRITGGNLELPRPFYDTIFPKLESIYKTQMPGFSGEMTVDEYLLLNGIIGGSFKGTPLETQEKPKTYEDLKQIFSSIQAGPLASAFQEALKQGRDQFSKTIGVEVNGGEKMKDVLYKLISGQISSNLDKNKQISTAALIFFFFILIKVTISFIGFLYVPIAFLIFKIFQKTGFFKLEEETVQREKITI